MYILISNILKYKKIVVEILVRIELRIIKISSIHSSNNSIRDFRVFNIKNVYNVDNYIHIIKRFLTCELIII